MGCGPASATPSPSTPMTHPSSTPCRGWCVPRTGSNMPASRPLRIGITCYPSVGGSGILATSLGIDLAHRGHDVHFIGYERPFRLPPDAPRVQFHPVGINAYGLFKYPDYTLPLSVKMAEVSREYR